MREQSRRRWRRGVGRRGKREEERRNRGEAWRRGEWRESGREDREKEGRWRGEKYTAVRVLDTAN